MGGGPETGDASQARTAGTPLTRGRVLSVRGMLAVATVATAVCTVVATVLVLGSGSQLLGDRLTGAFGLVAAALFLGSGGLRISQWRLTGESRCLLMGAALVVLGGLSIPMTNLAGVIMRDSETSLLRAMTALTSTLVVLTLVVRALHSPPEGGSLRPLRIVVPAAVVVAATFTGLVAVYAVSPGLLTSTLVPPPAVRGSLLAIAWFAVGLEAAMRSTQLPWAGRVAPLLGCMAVAEMLRVISVVHPGAWEVTGAALVALIASITAHRALRDLEEAVRADRANHASPTAYRSGTETGAAPRRAWRDELLHDALNTLAGLRAALATLEQYGARLDPTTRDRLRAAALGEVSHLEHLIIHGERDATVDFDLEPVLRTVVETRRAMGMQIELSDCDVRAHGRPVDVATVLHNLLVNAAQHAAGPVSVTVRAAPETVEIRVVDSGPGMPATQLARLFQRGARGPQSTGSGLGLHVAHTLMQQQSGDLRLHSHADGCTFAMSLWGPGGPTPVLPTQRGRVRWPRPAQVLPAE
jgi:signal transduction histidine kinase